MIVTREQREEHEALILAPYALKSRESSGRVYPDTDDHYRTAFQRDRDRILHTTAFRRLEYKTQVFVNYEGDYYRTRLTHTLEVAQIGRSLARALGANEDLVEAICLSHDLGHSPFGHAGEDILNELMADHGGFNHNKQSYRIVTKLERRYPEWPGLNLTYELREGIAKHESEYDIVSPGDFDASLRGSLEAQIANVADEMAYNAHDVDDGLRAGLLEIEQLHGLDIWRLAQEQLGWDGKPLDEHWRYQLHRTLIRLQINDVIDMTARRLDESGAQTPLDVQRLPYNVAGYSDEFARIARKWKDFLYENLYHHFRVMRMTTKAKRFVRQLFSAYLEEPRQLPGEIQAQFAERGAERAVVDYIAGMTDRFALQEWQRLFDPFTRT
jgi:dGTPase